VRTRAPRSRVARALAPLLVLALLGGLLAGLAHGERTQYGNLIVSLDGGLSPLQLPRDHLAPVAIRLDGGLQTADHKLLPRVTRIELDLPGQGVLSTKGLPTCSRRRLRYTTDVEALRNCRAALVGRGRIDADVVLPNQPPFGLSAHLLAFNGRVGGQPAVILHAFAARPPTVVVVAFLIRRRAGRFGTALVADIAPALGPWPHFAHFELTLSRRFTYGGHARSYISASCPVPPRFTAGFFSFARATYTLAGGRRVSTSIARGCRARAE
jgi:hypothetical protein